MANTNMLMWHLIPLPWFYRQPQKQTIKCVAYVPGQIWSREFQRIMLTNVS